MPSPFPGMDPYLEHPEYFPDLHDSLILHLREALQAHLPQPYYTRLRSRVWVEVTGRGFTPDINLLRKDQPSKDPRQVGGTEGTLAVALRPADLAQEEMREPFLEVRTARGDHQLVTAVEILSLSNKNPGPQSRTLYLEKQDELRKSRVNLVEIDLLRGGQHTTLARRESMIAAGGAFDYHICVRKMDDLEQAHVNLIRLDRKLPEIVIPLLPGDGGIKIDLQAVFTRCYDAAAYDRGDPYQQAPEPRLTPEQVAWAEKLLRDKDLLPPA